MSAAIVAIPSEDDYVWNISSEKVPHMTLLFLGDLKEDFDYQDVVEFIRHTTDTTLSSFGMSVARRGNLGDEDADVLFFDEHNVDKLKVFRYNLLTNRHIKEAYLSADQFPSWTPHLTLGYPDSPAHPDERDYPGISWINFDKIAFWTGDYSGPEFFLNKEDLAMGSLAEQGLDFLEHYGIKGMKWGVRRKRGADGRVASEDSKRTTAYLNRAKSSSVASLTNNELMDLNNRLQLEQNFYRLTQSPSRIKSSQTAIRNILSTGKTINDAISFVNSPTGKALQNIIKK